MVISSQTLCDHAAWPGVYFTWEKYSINAWEMPKSCVELLSPTTFFYQAIVINNKNNTLVTLLQSTDAYLRSGFHIILDIVEIKYYFILSQSTAYDWREQFEETL